MILIYLPILLFCAYLFYLHEESKHAEENEILARIDALIVELVRIRMEEKSK